MEKERETDGESETKCDDGSLNQSNQIERGKRTKNEVSDKMRWIKSEKQSRLNIVLLL